MEKIAYSIFGIALAVLCVIAIVYTPTADYEDISLLNISENNGIISVSGKMKEGCMYRGYKVDAIGDNYFLTVKRGLVGSSDFSFEIDESKTYGDLQTSAKPQKVYFNCKNADNVLIYGE